MLSALVLSLLLRSQSVVAYTLWGSPEPAYPVNTPRPVACRSKTACSASAQRAATDTTLPQQETMMIFISLSLPDETLKQLYRDSQRSVIPTKLVLRGLYQDSFLRTAERLKELGIQVQMHPELFERYHITAVPSFVFIRSKQAPIRLQGSISLSFALAQARKADAS
jgi:type-F conjugative transfer system pilin assembly protein TrbC